MPGTVRSSSPDTPTETIRSRAPTVTSQADKESSVDRKTAHTNSMRRSASLARKSYAKKFRTKRRSSVTESDLFDFEKEAILVDDNLPTDQRAQVVDDLSTAAGAGDRPQRRMLKNLDNTPFRSRPRSYTSCAPRASDVRAACARGSGRAGVPPGPHRRRRVESRIRIAGAPWHHLDRVISDGERYAL